MVSIAFESLLANPFNNACSFVSPFTICAFNTMRGVKVTQNTPKIFLKKIGWQKVTFFASPY